MKLALRNIPAEVWVDIFRYPWISRKQLGKIVDRFRNRKFTEILQYCLHDMGKRTLGYMYLNKQFHSAKSACTFAIEFDDCESLIADFLLENTISEQLHGQFNEAGLFQILRHQPNAGAALQEWVEEIEGKSYGSSVIEFFDGVIIGSIGSNAGAVDNADEEDQPSTSSFISSISNKLT